MEPDLHRAARQRRHLRLSPVRGSGGLIKGLDVTKQPLQLQELTLICNLRVMIPPSV
jgi:hypothetical protein